jgi:hypothetical protein
VQDLIPYFQDNCSDEEIIRWIPVLTAEEIGVVRQYYFDHRAALDEQDRRIRERSEERIGSIACASQNQRERWKSGWPACEKNWINTDNRPARPMKGQRNDTHERTCR